MTDPGTPADIAARLAKLDAKLAELHARYEVLTNAFKFDEARALVAPIEAAERERVALAAALPPPEPPSSATPYAIAHRRRRRGR